jgi:hypothetical protein
MENHKPLKVGEYVEFKRQVVRVSKIIKFKTFESMVFVQLPYDPFKLVRENEFNRIA